jgi:hypothetical protein
MVITCWRKYTKALLLLLWCVSRRVSCICRWAFQLVSECKISRRQSQEESGDGSGETTQCGNQISGCNGDHILEHVYKRLSCCCYFGVFDVEYLAFTYGNSACEWMQDFQTWIIRRKSQECFVLNNKWGGSHAVGSNSMIITAWRGR